MSEELIRLVNISKEYDGEKVLDQINLYILRNEFLTLLGPSWLRQNHYFTLNRGI